MKFLELTSSMIINEKPEALRLHSSIFCLAVSPNELFEKTRREKGSVQNHVKCGPVMRLRLNLGLLT